MLKRKVWSDLEGWRKRGASKALLIAGARQIGKTTIVREFAKSNYRCFAELNFLEDPKAASIFEGSLNADEIVANLTAYLRVPLEPGSYACIRWILRNSAWRTACRTQRWTC